MKVIKNLLIVGILCITTTFANVNDAKDEKKNKEILDTLYEKVIITDVKRAIKDIKSLKEAVVKNDERKSKEEFSKLVNSWKSIETFYILGDINEDFIDTPRYIDIFHNGNEDITEQLDRAIKSKDEIRVVLFKNSLKSINALEYMLFSKDIKNIRENKITITILDRITSHLNDIKDEYILQKDKFLGDLKKANAVTINAIIQNTYKLKEWRVGDVAGFTKKYEDDPDNKRAEYFLSKNSSNAIEAVLNTYKNILDNEEFTDYGDYLIRLTDGKEMKRLRESLNKSLELVKQIKNDDFSNTKELYENINTIHVVLFVEMLEELSINAKILDADGD
ncbi:imelysin family protein [Poseidonibacter ostreae]|jgi:predicted lipoprotein|uniref:Imelysin-like domain-containing protein n=1 Tax=Poseidonibacter ostreae TaxID=2654171 RepID=A0A6L4WRX4_9BACT|nr:imelysin family protein [Poseidonibacter ostreae]KAB7886143.1 hypothetical protein GA417_06285 [Poseidonibacter ostreae]KAB7887808.1 hypothetical protein GBG18_13710 [Poseidonibacter ostreae]KAB7888559.1 hypothetical protein GBG19_08605 [Poseidonibacter ostreae]